MTEIGAKERFDHRMQQPYQPRAATPGYNATAEDRMAHSLEYIAFQLGEINARLKRAEESRAKGSAQDP